MNAVEEYGFVEQQQIAIQADTRDTLYEECVPMYAVACLAQLAFKITKLSYFTVLCTSTYTALCICLARKAFQDYTFFQSCERKCIALSEEYPLLPGIMMVIAAHTRSMLPLMSLALSLGAGAIVGFTLRVKWLSCVMHSST